ncbi:hypothetical protein ABTM81_19190, partial [Acinetobacter baumannii]
AFALSFEKSGKAAGQIAGRILKGADPATIPPYRATAAEHEPVINGRKLKSLGIELPAAFAGCNCIVD